MENEVEELPYDKTNPNSIFEYGKNILGKTLREVVIDKKLVKRKGKGGLGQLVEELYFNYKCNSDMTPDFIEAGLELKATPLKYLRTKELQVKERLVCGMIDYFAEIEKSTFEESHFYMKCSLMLILFYIHNSDVELFDLKFQYAALWDITSNEKDFIIIRQDYETIMSKIRQGNAHELSEGDTIYLGACRKGYSGQKPTGQPYSDILAPQRAYSLKPSYVRTILSKFNKEKVSTYSSLTSIAELKIKNFEDIIIDKFKPYYGKSDSEIRSALKVRKTLAKQKNAILCNAILGVSTKKFEEFEKADIEMKTINFEASGSLKEAMSFKNIDFMEIADEKIWEESEVYNLFTSRFFFVVFEKNKDTKECYLKGAFFWTMPQDDLLKAKSFWKDTRNKVNTGIFNNFYSIADDKEFHIRPKGTKFSYKNRALAPNGKKVDKKAYWFNTKYVKKITEKFLS